MEAHETGIRFWLLLLVKQTDIPVGLVKWIGCCIWQTSSDLQF